MRVLIASVLLACSWTSPVRAAELPLTLEWSAPEECGSRARVLSEVARIVGNVDEPAPAHVTARAEVKPLGDGRVQVSLVTEVNGVSGERTLVGSDCAEVRRGTALILALMINPDATLLEPAQDGAEREEEATGAPAAPREQPPAPAPAPATRRETPVAPDESWAPNWLLGAGALGGVGALPKPSVGGELRVGVRVDWFALELQFSGWVRRSEQAKQLAGAGGEFELFGVGLVVGYEATLWGGGQGRLGVGAAGRRMSATGYGVSDPGSATGYWPAALLEASVAQNLSQGLALRLRSGADLPLNPPRFAIRGVGVVHRPAPVEGFVALGLELLF